MILCIDAGNTETAAGAFDGDRLLHTWRVSTDPRRTADEWGLLLEGLLASAGLGDREVAGVGLASVVPVVTRALGDAARSGFSVRARVVEADTPLSIRLDVEQPHQVGPDRIVNTLATYRIYRRNAVIVDLGTATTFDCVSSDGAFLGGVIMPGVRTSADRLIERTARLPRVGLEIPERVIGRSTEACIQSGVFFGTVAAIDGVVRRILSEWNPADPIVVATGGLAPLLAPHCETVDEVRSQITLEGIRMAFEEMEEIR